MMFHQIVAPIGASLPLSFAVGAIPVAVVLFLLGVLRRPAWQASLAGIAIALPLALFVWRMPPVTALSAISAGAAFAAWPIVWIVFNALAFYNLTVETGRFALFQEWLLHYLPMDRRVVLVVVGFLFGALLEGVAGFGAPIAITSALLISLGFQPVSAVVYALIFNTAPVAFGALGAPVATLAAVTQLPDHVLGAMIGRQLPALALILPFYVIILDGGFKAVRGCWPVLLIAGGTFGTIQLFSSNYLSYALTDVLSPLTALAATLVFLRLRPLPPDSRFALSAARDPAQQRRSRQSWGGWTPWLLLVAMVIAWVHFKVNLIGHINVEWPLLHNRVFATTYGKPYAAVWAFQPLATGTAILASALIFAAFLRVSPRALADCYLTAYRQARTAGITTLLIVGLAYLLNYSGITFTLGLGIAHTGPAFPLVSAFLGWLAVFLTGSDTSGNALFGNLQVVAARSLGLDPVLMAATTASGGVLGKMISPQNICTGTAVAGLHGREGEVLAKTFKHSVALTLLLGVIVAIQQHLTPWMIPHY